MTAFRAYHKPMVRPLPLRLVTPAAPETQQPRPRTEAAPSSGRASSMSGKRGRRKITTLRKRDGDVCWICDARIDFTLACTHDEAATLDHVVPRADGGRNHNDNLRLAHRVCNETRGNFHEQARRAAA